MRTRILAGLFVLVLVGIPCRVALAEEKPAEVDIDLLVPDEIKPTGEHGTVVLEGDVDPEGRLANPTLASPSKSHLLNQFALKRFDRAPVDPSLIKGTSPRIRITLKFYNTRGLDFGAKYQCRQVTLDRDWYKAAFSTEDNEKTPLYLLIKASGTLLGNQNFAFASNDENYDRIWAAAIDACRSAPGDSFLKVLLDTSKRKH